MRLHRVRVVAVLVLALITVLVAAPSCRSVAHRSAHRSAGPSAAQPGELTSRGGHKLLVILLENHSGAQAMHSMPNLRFWANHFGQASNYHAIAHPSLPNYLAIWGGSTFGVTSDCSVGTSGCRPRAPSVFSQTIAAGRSARAYEESMGRDCQTTTAGRYAARHGPWPYWLDARERRLCRANDVPSGTTRSGALATDVKAGTLPVTGELTPDFCNDGHDCPLSTADHWLKGWVTALRAGPDWRHGRLTIVITFDEDDYTTVNKVAFVVLDPRLSHVVVRLACNHFCLTRWLDENARVPLLRRASSAPDLRGAFHL